MSLGAPLAEPLSHQHWLLPLRPNLLAQLLGLLPLLTAQRPPLRRPPPPPRSSEHRPVRKQ